MRKTPVLCYEDGWYHAYTRNHLTPGTYTHHVSLVWLPDLTVFGSAPTLLFTIDFSAFNYGGTTSLPGYTTVHVGGTTGFPRFADVVDSDAELITASSGIQIVNLAVPWAASLTNAQYSAEVAFSNPGGVAPVRLAWNTPAGQLIRRGQPYYTIRAQE